MLWFDNLLAKWTNLRNVHYASSVHYGNDVLSTLFFDNSIERNFFSIISSNEIIEITKNFSYRNCILCCRNSVVSCRYSSTRGDKIFCYFDNFVWWNYRKKILLIELSKNRLILKAVVTCMNNHKFLRNFTTDRSQQGV